MQQWGLVEPRGIEPRTDRCQRSVFPLNYGPTLLFTVIPKLYHVVKAKTREDALSWRSSLYVNIYVSNDETTALLCLVCRDI